MQGSESTTRTSASQPTLVRQATLGRSEPNPTVPALREVLRYHHLEDGTMVVLWAADEDGKHKWHIGRVSQLIPDNLELVVHYYGTHDHRKPLEDRVYQPYWFDAKARRFRASLRSDREHERKYAKEEPWETRVTFDEIACAGFELARGKLPTSMATLLSSLRQGDTPVYVVTREVDVSAGQDVPCVETRDTPEAESTKTIESVKRAGMISQSSRQRKRQKRHRPL